MKMHDVDPYDFTKNFDGVSHATVAANAARARAAKAMMAVERATTIHQINLIWAELKTAARKSGVMGDVKALVAATVAKDSEIRSQTKRAYTALATKAKQARTRSTLYAIATQAALLERQTGVPEPAWFQDALELAEQKMLRPAKMAVVSVRQTVYA